MDSVFTLQWPEFLLANELQKMLPKAQGYSVLIPTSRQEKGIDLAIIKKARGNSRVATIQIKASRTYMPDPPKRHTTERYRYYTWFNRFDVPDDADFFLLFGMYPPDGKQTKSVNAQWYQHLTLLFDHEEMKELMSNCRTRSGRPDKMFGFGFDNEKKVVLTRGDEHGSRKDYSHHLLQNRIDVLRNYLSSRSHQK